MTQSTNDTSFINDAILVNQDGSINDSTPLRSDLVIEFGDILETPTIFPDESGKVNVRVSNQDTSQFDGDLDINLYASTDSILNNSPLNTLDEPLQGKDELLGTLKLEKVNIESGKSKTFTLDFASPEFRTASVVSPGAYYLIAEVDPGNTIVESNETNNLANTNISTDGSDVVIDWNATLLNAIQNEQPGGTLSLRAQAIVHTAIYDAVNAIDRSYEPYFVNIDADDSRITGASVEAVAVEAAYQSLIDLYPNQKATFDEQRARSLAEIPDGTAEDKGVALGKYVADQILALRSTDGVDTAQIPYAPGTDVDDWQPTPPNFAPALLPGLGSATPFAIPNVEEFRPDGPPEFGSAEYAQELSEVKVLGEKDSTVRTAEQTEIAEFWAYDRPDTFRSSGQWNEIAQEVALEQGNTLVENARLFALLNIAEFDSLLVAWDAKYTYEQLRPITAIRNGNTDGNPDTIADPNWESLLVTPPFPDYIAAHSAIGGAASEVLANFFGDNVSFSIPSQELPGVARSYSSFTQAAEESGMSRIYGGVHVQSSNRDGLAAGTSVADYIFDNIL